jgi:MFS family permease
LNGSPDQDPIVERRNFLVNIVEGALFVAGSTFISVQTVLPAMIYRLGGSNVAVGALAVITWGGLFLPQVFAARYVETLPWKKPWTIRLGLLARVFVGLIAINLLLFAQSDPPLALGVFLLLYALMHVALGVTTPGWYDLVAKVTPVTRRGRMVGFRSSLAGTLGFACSFALVWLLSSFRFPVNYTVAFAAAFLLQAISLAVQMQLVETTPSPVTERRSVQAFLSEIPGVLRRQRDFRRFIVSTMFLVLATVSGPFFTVHAIKAFGADASTIGRFTMVMVAAQVVSAPIGGYLADRSGNRTTLLVAASSLLVAALWAWGAPSLNWYYPVFAFLGMNIGSEMLARYNMAVEFAPEHRRAAFLGIMNALLAPCYAVGLAGGWVSDRFGYHVVFLGGALCSAAGILMMSLVVKDPRTATEMQEKRAEEV